MPYSGGVQRDAPTPIPQPIRELTPRSIVLGIALALILGAANAYLGLYAGLTVSASIPAAVISMAILRILGGSTILENNVVQTIASAGEAVAAGAIFTFPALVILGGVRTLPYVEVTALCVVGATMGALLVVFLRRAYIVEERLPFPEGVACAQVLRAGDAQANVRPLVVGGLVSAALKALQDVAGIIPGAVSGARWVGGAAVAGSLDISAALLGVGYIIGIRIAALVFAGGAFAWLVAIPVLTAFHGGYGTGDAATTAQQLWSGQVRYLGVGAMLTGGIVTLWKLRTRIASAIADSIRVVRSTQAVATAREDTDLSARAVLTAVALCVPVIFAICLGLSGSVALSAALAILLTLICFFATAIAGYLTGIVGASNNPVSGVTVIVLLAVALFLKLVGVSQSVGPQLAILSGAIVCTAAAMAGDSTHDLATGFHVGATPRSLEIGVLVGAIASSFLMAPILNLLIAGYGIAGTPTARAGALAAPQAFLMAKVTQGVFHGGLPLGTIAAGAVLAAILGFSDRYLERTGSKWRTPIMPAAIGLYLPFGLSVAIFIGAVAHSLFGSQEEAESGPGILLAAGLVAGEALMGVASGAMVTAGIKLPIF
ncbi:MAG TPA: oligopeptide transporter, OPT family [Candidatus Acidoferrales bacterium]|jgi:putative OPT family oligopeptide transporter|nr:oligopeptide transporter, OPT family [Candidatus Acidoferrales bacterium]